MWIGRRRMGDGMGICNLINHGWTRIWFANAHRYYVMACAVMLGGLAIAAESISITATPRYPWNGKVDLKFTIDGTSGTKYDTSFTAKDVAGGTNFTMKTLYKSDGTAANAGKEQLLPGTYDWVWDATADLGEGTVLEKVVVEGKTEANNPLYMAVELSTGKKTYFDIVPSGGWSDAYKTTSLLLRRIERGANSAGGSMTQDMWVGVFEVTEKQYVLLKGSFSKQVGSWEQYVAGDNPKYPIRYINLDRIRGFLNSFSSKSGLNARVPSVAEWQYACRAGTVTDYSNGKSASEANLAPIARFKSSSPTDVGSYEANPWGLFDMHGNISETTSDSEYAAGSYLCWSCGGYYHSSYDECKSSSKHTFSYYNESSYDGVRVFVPIQ